MVKRKESENKYQSLFELSSLKRIPITQSLKNLADLIDLSFDLKRSEGLQKSLDLSQTINQKKLSSCQRSFIFYCLGNLWDDLRLLSNNKDNDKSWYWDQPEFKNELINYRKALLETGFNELDKTIKCMLYTNLANTLDTIGRFIEAIEYWDKALEILPDFGMALANKALGIEIYAKSVYDPYHKAVFLKHAQKLFKSSNKDLRNYPEYFYVIKSNMDHEKRITEWLGNKCKKCDCQIKLNKEPINGTKGEIIYRNWCLRNRLFLHPINDLGNYSSIAYDFISTPNITTNLNIGPKYQGFFNQIKQEFVSARFLYFDGMHSNGTHFSDKDVSLINTLDYPVYCLAIEKIKLAFRSSYSIFDKIANFLNDYLNLKKSKKERTFLKIWYIDKNKQILLNPELYLKKNLPLRGLYWLSKDLYDDKENFKNTIEPEAKKLLEIRNQLEHRYLKIHDHEINNNISSYVKDDLAYSLSIFSFEAKTLKLLKLVRSAILYLSFAIYVEEKERDKNRDKNKIVVPMIEDQWHDEWKRIN